MKRIAACLFLFFFSACAYHNPLDKADFRFQTLNTPPYVLSGWYRVKHVGAPLTVYIEKENLDLERRNQAVSDPSENVAYLGRPCQYIQTGICQTSPDKALENKAIQKGILQLQKKAKTESVIIKGLE